MPSAESAVTRRLGGAAGIAFVLLFLAATFVGGSELGGPDQTAETIARDLSENRIDGLRLHAALVALAAVTGYWFVAEVHKRLSARSDSVAVWAALGGGFAMVTMVLGTSTFAQAAIVVDSLASDPQVAKALWLIEHGSWALMGPPQIAFILGVSVIALAEGYPPRWYGYSGLVVVVGLVANMMWGLGSLAGLGLLWVLGLAALLTMGRTGSTVLEADPQHLP
jgi:hypothetical protein